MSSNLCRTLLLTLVVLVLAAAAPVFAEPAQVVPSQPAAASLDNQPACAPSLDFLAPKVEAPLCQPAVNQLPAQPEFMATKVFHGHCRCSCSRIPDCNTSADCGGAPCLGGITCC
jgi:hypothetical protein